MCKITMYMYYFACFIRVEKGNYDESMKPKKVMKVKPRSKSDSLWKYFPAGDDLQDNNEVNYHNLRVLLCDVYAFRLIIKLIHQI